MSAVRDGLLAALEKFKHRPVVLEDGTTVYVRPLSAVGVSRITAVQPRKASKPGEQDHPGQPERAVALYLIDCLCDENGVRILTDADEKMVADMPSTVANRIMDAINQMSFAGEDGFASAEKN